MSVHDKLLMKLLRDSPPKDFKFDDLVTLLGRLGFEMREQAGGSSHKYFILRRDPWDDLRIYTSRPHPDGILKAYQVREIRARLMKWGLI